MGRSISVSTDVYAAIWAARERGEDTEDAILARILSCKVEETQHQPVRQEGDGFLDARNGVHFPEEFEIFRRYRGKPYSAVASRGIWIRKDNQTGYRSLNQLNASITAGNENVWNGNWKYRASDGTVQSISRLRS